MTGPYPGFSEGGFEMEMKVTKKKIIFASGPITTAWGMKLNGKYRLYLVHSRSSLDL